MIIKPEDRLAYIKKAAAKFNKKVKRNARVRDYTTPDKDRSIDDSVNINAWTDGSKYLDEHYGDRVRSTREYESNWD
jgi:hypothetical protein